MPSSALRSSRIENWSRPPTSSRTEAGQVIPTMLDRIETANSLTEIAGVRIELIKRGTGRPLLLLHPAIGIKSTDRVIEELARSFTLIAPAHPGFGRSELPRAITTGRSRLFLSRPHGSAGLTRGDPGGRVVRWLDRGGDRDQVDRTP